MGCSSSSAAPLEESPRAPKVHSAPSSTATPPSDTPNGIDHDSNGFKPRAATGSLAPVSEGERLGSSSSSGKSVEEQARTQRRRLSVAPQHVGDITRSQVALLSQGRPSISDAKASGPLNETELQSKGSIKHAVLSRKGYVPYNKNKVNQDRFVLRYAMMDDPSICMWGVMDGHGEFGHLVAAFIESALPTTLSRQRSLKENPIQSIKDAVREMCDHLAQSDINAAFSGSTLVFGVKIGDTIHIANVGDSRCILIYQNDDGSLACKPLSVDQKPEVPEEKARIERAGGRVEPLPGPPGECGPPRVWLAESDVPGLAMSRSIGDDVSQTVGVISVPEIVSHQVTSNDIFMIWASDGVWEFLSNEAVMNIVWQHRANLTAAVANLVEESSKCWRREEEVIDDITAVIVQLNEPK